MGNLRVLGVSCIMDYLLPHICVGYALNNVTGEKHFFKIFYCMHPLGSWVCSGCKVKTPGRRKKGQIETPITSPPRRKIQPQATAEVQG